MSEADFQAAVQKVNNLATRPDDSILLQLYGLYKQATVGDNNTDQPWAIQVTNRAKWDAWESRKGMSQEAARAEYIAVANSL